MNVFNSLRKSYYNSGIPFLRVLVIALCLIAGASLFAHGPTVLAKSIDPGQFASISCPEPAAPSSQSLLVVLLDRSGSLTEGTSPTDPEGYSTSVTKALADLWPGLMAVIPFSGDTISLPVFGPATLTNPIQLTDLKQKVQDYAIGGDTPLAPALQQALNLLHSQGAPAGSRVVIITDGSPTGIGDNDGPHQEQDIRTDLIPQFCKQGIPVYAFGLTINLSTPDGQDATHLLTAISSETGATYNNVQNAKELANNVILLFAQWRHLNFTQVTRDSDGNFPVLIDPFADSVNIITFRSNENFAITLIGPDGQPVTQAHGLQRSTPSDTHYEIDTLNVSPPIVSGTYKVNVSGDPDAQVYALVKSRLQVQLIAPTSRTVIYTGQSIPIEATLLDGQNQLTPQKGDATLLATITLLVGGRAVRSDEMLLKQQAGLFTIQTPAYKQSGELQIIVRASYQGVERQAQILLQIQQPPVLSSPTQRRDTLSSAILHYLPPVMVVGIVGVFLFVLTIWSDRRRRGQEGVRRV